MAKKITQIIHSCWDCPYSETLESIPEENQPKEAVGYCEIMDTPIFKWMDILKNCELPNEE